ncbi:MAG: prevent-host-death family protein [Corynebacterium sp.]|uniref:type II toxin-antitoxin system Phd/YefM family antitoxin n=1 Tax=Corynebacterium sp. TaxID=1720 RepID=UPI0026DC9CCD|nr:prevent-host-death family protein [Corynebacterium sp.]MDO4761287.1 prevent-host-death family protein [Corynebacterium sp.]
MAYVTLSQFHEKQNDYIVAAQHEPVILTSREARRRAVVVSPEFYDRALQAIEELEDIRATAEARNEIGRVSHDELIREFGI